MSWQSKSEMQEMMKNMMESRAHHGAQGRSSIEPEGGAQGAEPAAASSGHMSASGTFVISNTRTSLPPKYDGTDKSKCALWRREFLSYLFQHGCREALNYTASPVRIGSEDAVESESGALYVNKYSRRRVPGHISIKPYQYQFETAHGSRRFPE